MLKALKLIHNRHSGKLRPHEHTSYLLLSIVMLIVGIPLTAFTVYADPPPHPEPVYSSVGLTGIMPSEPPDVSATIDYPSNQQSFLTSPIEISGTCPDNTLVEIFKNDIFGGSTICTSEGTYVLSMDMLNGSNTLVARVYDSLNQQGPDSNIVTIFYNALPTQASPLSPLNFGSQMLVSTDAVFRGVFPGKELSVPITVIGGTVPYAINIQWGDGQNTVTPRNDNASFSINHVYSKAGTYQLSIQVTDANGNVAFLTVAVIVNGQPSIISGTTTSSDQTNILIVLWPLYAAALVAVISFWLGEVREKRVLRARGLLFPS